MADFPVGSDVPVDTLDTQVLSTASTIGLSPLLNKLLALGRALIAKVGTGASTPVANSVLVGNGTGTSAWLVGLTSAYIGANAATQSGSAVGVSSSPTTTSTTFVDLTDMSVTLTTTGGDLIVWFSGIFFNGTATATVQVALSLDAATEVAERYIALSGASEQATIALSHRFAAPSAASHTVKVRWKVSTGTGTAPATFRGLVVTEHKK